MDFGGTIFFIGYCEKHKEKHQGLHGCPSCNMEDKVKD
jgi:hypothetical protein